MKKTAILGFGNPARSDDGIGCYVANELSKILADQTELTILDMGTSAFEVLFQLQGHQRIILIDAVINSAEEDGSVFRLPASEVEASIQEDPMVFLHALKWDQALSYAKKIMRDSYPKDIEVFLIAISNTRLEIGLSEPVEAAGQRVVQLIKEDILATTPSS